MCNTYTPGKLNAIAQGKCPRCHSGKIFMSSAVKLRRFTLMFDTCPVCGLHYEVEPGFFWGSMYVSYALTTGMMIVLGALTFLIGNDPDFWIYMLVIGGSVLVTSPLTYRYSRILLLHFFAPVKFEEKLANKG
jgi:uncharacterized protein (DUF983 family)